MKKMRWLILTGLLSVCLFFSNIPTPADQKQRDSPDRFLAVEAWMGDFKVEFQRTIDMSIPLNLVNRHTERSQSIGRVRLDAAHRVNLPGGYIAWNGEGRASAGYFKVSETQTAAFTGSGLTEGQASLDGDAVLTIYPSQGHYQVLFRPNGLVPVVERTWTELNPVIEHIAAAAKSGDLEDFLIGWPALLVTESFPPPTTTERQAAAPSGSSDSQPLPDSGLVLSGSREYGGITFSWSLRPALEDRVRIYFAENGRWRDVTDQTTDVMTGQRIKLEGRAIRLSEVVGFDWDIDGLDEGQAIDDWVVDNNSPRVIPVEDTKSSTIDFAWWAGEEYGQIRNIVFKAILEDGEELTAETSFRVYKPRTVVDTKLGSVAVREVRGAREVRRRVEGEIKKLEIEQARLELGLLDPATSKGAVFTGEVNLPARFKNTPYEMQYVQLVSWDAYELGLFTRVWQRDTSHGEFMLDGEYPYPSKREGDAQHTDDMPAHPLSSWSTGPSESWKLAAQCVMDFETHFMFRPEGDNSIWVPLKTITWGWRGYATYKDGGRPSGYMKYEDFRLVDNDVVGPKVTEASRHPDWANVAIPGKENWKVVKTNVSRADEWNPPSWRK